MKQIISIQQGYIWNEEGKQKNCLKEYTAFILHMFTPHSANLKGATLIIPFEFLGGI